MKYAAEFSVERMCRIMGVSRSGYYSWKKRKAMPGRSARDTALEVAVAAEFDRGRQRYGSPRLSLVIRAKGYAVSTSTVARIMRSLGLCARSPKRYVRTTDSDHDLPIAENLLQRNFCADRPAQKWVSDITYVATEKGWCYLTTVIDLFDRCVVGWVMSKTMKAEDTVVAAFRRAVRNRRPPNGLIFHSDRGSQYASETFRSLLAYYQAIPSMSAKGDCYDNAVAESFFKTIKNECLYRHAFLSMEHAERYAFDYIDGWYNTQRIHTSLEGKAPLDVLREFSENAPAA